MKVLCVICDDKWMTNAFVSGWKSLGVEVDTFFYSPNLVRVDYSPQGRQSVYQMNLRLIEYVIESNEKCPIDLIFCSILDDYITAETLKKLRRTKAPIVNYHCDMVALWFRSTKTAKYFDLFCCAHKHGMTALQKCGAKVFYSPMAGNEYMPIECTFPESEYFNGVTFLGAPIGYRPSILAHIYYNKIPLKIHGHNWDWCPREYDPLIAESRYFKNSVLGLNDKVFHDLYYYAPKIFFYSPLDFVINQSNKLVNKYFKKSFDVEEYYAHLPPSIILGPYKNEQFCRLVNSTAINLGFSHISGKEGSKFERMQVRLRDFEIPIAGGFYLAQYSEELADLFIEGVNIEFWRNRNELLDKVQFYLRNPQMRITIANNGREYANKHHLWRNRFQDILLQLNINA